METAKGCIGYIVGFLGLSIVIQLMRGNIESMFVGFILFFIAVGIYAIFSYFTKTNEQTKEKQKTDKGISNQQKAEKIIESIRRKKVDELINHPYYERISMERAIGLGFSAISVDRYNANADKLNDIIDCNNQIGITYDEAKEYDRLRKKNALMAKKYDELDIDDKVDSKFRKAMEEKYQYNTLISHSEIDIGSIPKLDVKEAEKYGFTKSRFINEFNGYVNSMNNLIQLNKTKGITFNESISFMEYQKRIIKMQKVYDEMVKKVIEQVGDMTEENYNKKFDDPYDSLDHRENIRKLQNEINNITFDFQA